MIWRKSTHSNERDACVEVVDNHPDGVPVRDSKFPSRPHIEFKQSAWSSFITELKNDAPFA